MSVDVTQNLLVTLALGQAQIDTIRLFASPTSPDTRTYLIYPELETALAYEGETVLITITLTNIGTGDATLFVQLSSGQVLFYHAPDGVQTGYWEIMVPVGSGAGPFEGLQWIFTMPNVDTSILIEAGHI